MKCKFCDAELEKELEVCPVCGKSLMDKEPIEMINKQEPEEETLNVASDIAVTVDSETQTDEVPNEIQQAVEDEQPAETIVDQLQSDETEQTETETTDVPKRKKWKLIAAICGAVVVLVGIAIALLFALGVIKLRPNDIKRLDVYTVADEKMDKAADKVVAKIEDEELTNSVLQIFYKMQVQDFLNYYGSYLSSIGLDYTKPFSEQTCTFDESLTWEQYFLDAAIKTWQNYQTMVILSEESEFALSEDQQGELDNFADTMQKTAEENGYETAEEMVVDILGAGTTVEDYAEYVRLVLVSNEFYSTEYTRLTPTDEEIEAYFDENEETFAESGITKDSGLTSSVRHILIAPEGGTEDEETGEVTYSKKEWSTAKKKAEALLKKWKNGEATEESFTALVKDNTDDTGSAETGGLYEDINPTSGYVEEFRAWAVDAERKTGDTAIVETEFGYHIMYFVSGEPYWLQEAGTMLLSERTTKMIDDAIEKYPMSVNYKKIAITNLDLE